MNDIQKILTCLELTPDILKNLIASIPEELLKDQRIQGKWTIHEHTCHIVAVQPMLIERCKIFLREKEPVIKPYIPGLTDPDRDLFNLDLTDTLNTFSPLRAKLIDIVHSYNEEHWTRKGKHHEYIAYTPYIMLRHILMHDHFHMYRIEELWLTTDEFLR